MTNLARSNLLRWPPDLLRLLREPIALTRASVKRRQVPLQHFCSRSTISVILRFKMWLLTMSTAKQNLPRIQKETTTSGKASMSTARAGYSNLLNSSIPSDASSFTVSLSVVLERKECGCGADCCGHGIQRGGTSSTSSLHLTTPTVPTTTTYFSLYRYHAKNDDTPPFPLVTYAMSKPKLSSEKLSLPTIGPSIHPQYIPSRDTFLRNDALPQPVMLHLQEYEILLSSPYLKWYGR